jgi:hypothetical protein
MKGMYGCNSFDEKRENELGFAARLIKIAHSLSDFSNEDLCLFLFNLSAYFGWRHYVAQQKMLDLEFAPLSNFTTCDWHFCKGIKKCSELPLGSRKLNTLSGGFFFPDPAVAKVTQWKNQNHLAPELVQSNWVASPLNKGGTETASTYILHQHVWDFD